MPPRFSPDTTFNSNFAGGGGGGCWTRAVFVFCHVLDHTFLVSALSGGVVLFLYPLRTYFLIFDIALAT